MKKVRKNQGFSLIELLVAIAIFTIIALLGTTAILVTISANKTSQSISQILSNFSIALEAMSRNVRVGSYYHCGEFSNGSGITFPLDINGAPSKDCDITTGGADNISFLSQDNTNWYSYFLSNDDQTIHKAVNGIDQGSITAPEVSIDTLKFYVEGAEAESVVAPDRTQPRVIMVIAGKVNDVTGKNVVPFNIQTTITQRIVR